MESYWKQHERAQRAMRSVDFGSPMTAWTREMLAWWRPERTEAEVREFLAEERKRRQERETRIARAQFRAMGLTYPD